MTDDETDELLGLTSVERFTQAVLEGKKGEIVYRRLLQDTHNAAETSQVWHVCCLFDDIVRPLYTSLFLKVTLKNGSTLILS